jgi:hypothetical protein
MCSLETDFISLRRKLEQDFPGIRILGYCNARNCFEESPCLPEDEFYIGFDFKEKYPSKKTWKSFRDFVQTITEYDLVIDDAKIVTDTVEVAPTCISGITFRIRGHEIRSTNSLGALYNDDETCPLAGSEPA